MCGAAGSEYIGVFCVSMSLIFPGEHCMACSLSAFALAVPSIWTPFLTHPLVSLSVLQASGQLFHCHREVFPAQALDSVKPLLYVPASHAPSMKRMTFSNDKLYSYLAFLLLYTGSSRRNGFPSIFPQHLAQCLSTRRCSLA